MSPQLLVRPGNNDHQVIEELLAPDSSSLLLPGDTRGPIDRVIVDAHVAQKRPQQDSYAKVLSTFEATTRAKQVSALRTYAWRDGIFGAGLCAAGIDGYEAGIATSEACNLSSSLAARKPKAEKRKSGGNAPGIFIDMLGRSVQAAVGRTLLASSLKDRVMCDDERCCPDGPASTIARPRQHAVRMRARQLRLQEGLPHSSWRLHQLSKDCTAGSTLVLQANQILKATNMKERLPAEGLNAMGKVARHLLSESAVDAA